MNKEKLPEVSLDELAVLTEGNVQKKESIMKKRNGWFIVKDIKGAVAANDPRGVTYQFVKFRDGKITSKGPFFTSMDSDSLAREEMIDTFEKYIKAVDKPFLRRKVHVEYTSEGRN
jgi:hypothetical protein